MAPVPNRYIVVLKGEQTSAGFQLASDVLKDGGGLQAFINDADATVSFDLSRQIGVMFVTSSSRNFVAAMRDSSLVEEVGRDFGWKQYPSVEEALAAGTLTIVDSSLAAPNNTLGEPLASQQWDMRMIRAFAANKVERGKRVVDVGILDSGVDGLHPDFMTNGRSSVDCARGHNSVILQPDGPGVGTPDPCVDNQVHGTHVAGTVGARLNGIGIRGVAPGVTIVPVKTCDASGYCYASAVVDGITYAGQIELDVINMSFFVDDDAFQESTEFKCLDDPEQRAFRVAVQRALDYAISRGVTPIAALGNSNSDLGPHDGCKVIPAESTGVIGVSALGPQSEKASYSSYGYGPADVAAPGGNGSTCDATILSTLPGGGYGCLQGTSMASPHAAGVAALIVSRFGTLQGGDMVLSPATVTARLRNTAIDIGAAGYDECFGKGRVDALRAVNNVQTYRYDAGAICGT
jgi:subtilisin family serine protease